MKGLILAAGRGSRMGVLTEDRPKCLTPLGGRTLLARQIASLRKGGCDEIGIVTGYRAALVAPAADRTFHNARWEETNMVASLLVARAWLQQEPVIVSYSDIFYAPETVADLAAAPGAVAIAYDRDWHALWSARFADPLSDAETFRLDEIGRVTEIGARAAAREEIEGQYMGLIKLTPQTLPAADAVLSAVPPARRDKLDMTSLLSALIGAGVGVFAVERRGAWGECDTASDLRLYETWIASGRLVLG
jgi:L-glutamine-phosphate cytidylyltransferase